MDHFAPDTDGGLAGAVVIVLRLLRSGGRIFLRLLPLQIINDGQTDQIRNRDLTLGCQIFQRRAERRVKPY